MCSEIVKIQNNICANESEFVVLKMALEGVKSDQNEENITPHAEVKANGTDNRTKQIEPNTAFLRAARAGQLDVIVDLLATEAVKDINTCNSNGLNALHLAAKEGHQAVVDELLKRGAQVDAATKKGNTALHISCLAGQDGVARALLAAGAGADAQSAAGFTPLYMAAQENHATCVKLLLGAGASQSLATEDGFTPLAVAMQQGHDRVVAELLESDTRGKVRLPALHIAAKKDDVKAATLLLENEHNPDACSKSGFTPLHIAAHYGNAAVARALLARGADANRAAKHNITPLHVAAKWGQMTMMDLLIEHGANIAAVTRDGLTPLHCAARSGHAALVSRLLHHQAPITSKTKNGLTPLHMSVQGEHVETARALLDSAAPIDDVTVDYLTPLHVAAHCGHAKVAKLLLDRNADANARALNGFTPLHIACKKNRLKVVELLLKYGASISSTTESGLTPLHVAAFMGCMNIAIHLLQHGAVADRATARGETPLHLAARAQQTDLIRILLRHGAQVDAVAREDQTPLHVASRLGHADIASLLLQHGADPAAKTKDAYTPLHIAAKEGKEEVAAMLLDKGAPLEAQTRKGFTPLHLAAKYGDGGVAKLLLQSGAEVDAAGKNGITPLHMATYYGRPDIALKLLDKGASPHALAKNGHSALHVACRNNHPDIAFALLEHGADPGLKSKAGFTPLHMAAQEGHEDCIEMLIERGADVNVQSNNGLTPLHLACAEGRVNVVRALLAAGANREARSREGYAPLHAAAHRGQHAACRALVDAGVDVHALTAQGYTPLHQAAQQGHTLIIHLLLKNDANPNALNNNGQTACAIADRLGYIGVVEALRPVTENTLSQAAGESGNVEGKYRAAAPELMQDTFMSDSEDEGGEVECPIQQQQQYRYMNADANTLSRNRPIEDTVTDGHLWPSNNDEKPTIDKQPVDIGFLVSFVVDARGGAMQARRRGGARVLVPPGACAAPTRVTCRAATRRAPASAPPPLMEGEALASRPLELQPQGAKFLAPVVIEVPIFASQCREREIVVLRSDTGDTWQDHYLHNSDNPMIQEALVRERLEGSTSSASALSDRVVRVVTCDFPHYLCVVSRVRQEVHVIGPEGGTISSSAIPQVQAVFPAGALTKRIRVGVQAHGASPSLVSRVLRNASVSPVLTVEPRRRKFHRTITLTMPLPTSYHQNQNETGASSTLRLLCSIMGGQARAVWEDVTGSTPLTVTADCANFTTTVSARFWLMDCRNIADATKMATDLYREMLFVPFEARLVVLGKRLDMLEGKLLVLYLTDRHTYQTLLQQEHYTEIAHSTTVQLLDGKSVYLEFSGNLLPVTKSGHQLHFDFEAFKDNRCEFAVRVKHQEENPTGRIYFMNDPKVAKGEQSQTPVCVLDVELPHNIAPRAGKSQMDCLNLDQSGFDALNDELSMHWGEGGHTLGRRVGNGPTLNGGDVRVKDNKTEDDDRRPHENGDSLKVDPHKAKATFDSDEDKTPSSTLEKNRKKSESPKAKDNQKSDKIQSDIAIINEKADKSEKIEKTSPKLINEDLLDKVEDMFADLKSQPKISDEEILENDIYQTKLIVDEGEDSKERCLERHLSDIKEENGTGTPQESELCEDNRSRVEKIINKLSNDNFRESYDDIFDDTAEEKLSGFSKDFDVGLNNVVRQSDSLSNDLEATKNNIKNNCQTNVNDKVVGFKNVADNNIDDVRQQLDTEIRLIITEAEDETNRIQDGISKLNSNAQETLEDLEKTQLKEIKKGADNFEEQVTKTSSDLKEDVNKQLKDVQKNVEEEGKRNSEELKKKGGKVSDGVQAAFNDVKSGANAVLSDAGNEAVRLQEDLAAGSQHVLRGVSDATQQANYALESGVEDLQLSSHQSMEAASQDLENVVSAGADKAKQLEDRLTDQFTSNLNSLGDDVFGSSITKGFMQPKPSASFIEAEKSSASPSPSPSTNKKNSGIPKLKKKK